MKNRAYLRALCDRYGYDITSVEATARALFDRYNAEPRTKSDTRALLAYISDDRRITARDDLIALISALIGFAALIALVVVADKI